MGGELSDTQEFGTAFNKTNTWYHVHAVIDMTDEKTTLTLTSKADESVTATKETLLYQVFLIQKMSQRCIFMEEEMVVLFPGTRQWIILTFIRQQLHRLR